jgi:hypothetical protein
MGKKGIINISADVPSFHQCYGSRMFIPDPNFSFQDPGSWIPDYFLALNTVAKLTEK